MNVSPILYRILGLLRVMMGNCSSEECHAFVLEILGESIREGYGATYSETAFGGRRDPKNSDVRHDPSFLRFV